MDQALQTMCPISKYKGKTLVDVLSLDPGALKWLANKFTGDAHIKEAAQMIYEYAVQHLELLLELYMPLINKYSYIDNVLDEDLRQYIMMHIALNISKFTIE